MARSLLSSVRRRAGGAATPAPRTLAPGVNAVGYFDRTSGLGERARVLLDVLAAAGVPVSVWPVAATASPSANRSIRSGGEVYPTTVAVVTAPQFPALVKSHASVLRGVERVVGYWFWEVEAIPDSHTDGLFVVDEIWAPTRFVQQAYQAVTDKPVHLVPLPIPEPPAPTLGRADVGLDERFTFLVSYDHLSVMERKHPLGAIEAFRRAFPTGGEPVRLVLKTLNGAVRPRQFDAVRQAAAGDPRIDVVDRHDTDDHHLALIAHADAYVSLHRSEGLGLQPAAAMWLGTPVIASRYSGTLDLMDDESAELIDVELVPARNTDGAYPPEARWADPDLGQAAAAMRRLVDDPARRASVIAAAQARRRADPDVAATARLVSRLLAEPAEPRRAAAPARPIASVSPMPDAPAPIAAPPATDATAVPATRDARSMARAATAPLRNYFNSHFEMVKHEVRSHTGDTVFLANLVHELEATVAETTVHQARTIARLQEQTVELSDRIAELERMVARLTDVVTAAVTTGERT